MSDIKRIGVLTSGGDAPGMNAAVRAVCRTALTRGVEVMGIYKGYSAYSSLQVLDDGTIGIIIEEGKWDSNLPGKDGFNLGCYRFTVDWLLEGDQK